MLLLCCLLRLQERRCRALGSEKRRELGRLRVQGLQLADQQASEQPELGRRRLRTGQRVRLGHLLAELLDLRKDSCIVLTFILVMVLTFIPDTCRRVNPARV